MQISTFEIKICGKKLCAQKDGFRKSSHISWLWESQSLATHATTEAMTLD